MRPEEKERLVALLLDAPHWCQGAEARAADGQAVTYSDADATAWDLTGAACHLFGSRRAGELFVQIDRHLHGGGIAGAADDGREIAAMVALQTWNDDVQTTHRELMSRLQSLPVRTVPGSAPGLPVEGMLPEGIER
jgi:hypothetical protein